MKLLVKSILFSVVLLFFYNSASAQSCEISRANGGGFTTTIESVVNNCNDTYTVVLRVSHNGCGGPSCKALSHFSVEAVPGTYSNVNVQVISGTMTYTNIDFGPNLGSDQFTGFKVDGCKNIGGGKAGTFTITYTLTYLQDQRASAKAGTNPQLVTFNSELDFAYVMNCNNTNCGLNPDTDGDGCYDADDEYPNDSTRCYSSSTGWETIAFEDLWPSTGDYDFNDLVCIQKYKKVYNSNNQLVELVAKYYVTAVGASFNNGLGVQFDGLSPSQVLQVNGSVIGEDYISLNSNGTESAQECAVIIVFDNVESVISRSGSSFFNTVQNGMIGTSDTVTIAVEFVQPVNPSSLGNSPFNPFLIQNGDREVEIHLANRRPTSLANPNYFGTHEDDTSPIFGKYYLSTRNLPWGIHVPTVFNHVIEKVQISYGYLKFVDWATSNGVLYPDWYLDTTGYRDHTKIW